MNIQEKVIKIIAEAINVEVNKIDEDTAIGDFPNWDSMRQLVVITCLEEEFDIKFDLEDIMELEDVADMIETIEEHINL